MPYGIPSGIPAGILIMPFDMALQNGMQLASQARRSDVQPLRIDITSGGEGFTFDDFIRDILNFLCFRKNLENAKHTSVPH
jgi:hypothetical protein